jgi:hypothetical protein
LFSAQIQTHGTHQNSLARVYGESPQAPLRREDAVVRSESQLMPDWYYLREEARKGWNYFITDSLVYRLKMSKRDSHTILLISKNDFGGKWLELNLRLVSERKINLRMVIEIVLPKRMGSARAEIVGSDSGMHRDVSMLVDIPKSVKNPEVMDLFGVRALVWLHASNNCDGFIRKSESAFNECHFGINGFDLVNRKAESLGDGLFGIGMGGEVHLPNQMVERCAETRNKVSSNQSHSEVELGRVNLNEIFSSFRIVLRRDGLEMRFSPEFYSLAQGIEVFLRPLDFVHYRANWHTEIVKE